MKKTFGLLFIGVVALGLATCSGGKDHERTLKDLTKKYWQAVLEGRMEEAYAMLTEGSRANVSLEEFTESMTFITIDGEGINELKQTFAEKTKLTILGIETKKKEATVTIILLVPTLATLQANLETQYVQGEIETDDLQAWMIGEMKTALEENRLPTQELRVKMTWILEGERWGFAFGQS